MITPKYIIKVGDSYTLNSGESCTVTSVDKNLIDIIFSTGNSKTVTSGDLRNGKVRNPLFKAYLGVGFEGLGRYKIYRFGGGKSPEGKLWMDMINRCYNPKRLIKAKSYIGCEVSEDWHNFQNFADWCQNQKGFKVLGWALDKDILSKESKIYSPDTCLFVPKELNNFFKNKTQTISVLTRSTGFQSKFYLQGFQTYSPKFETKDEAMCWYVYKKNETLKLLIEKYKNLLDERFLKLVNGGYYV